MFSIELRDIDKSYLNGAYSEKVLDQINLSLKEKETTVITGSSGAGKTTLLRILACIDACDRGEYLVNGKCISMRNDRKRAKYRKKWIGYIPQDNKILSDATVYDNIAFPLYLLKWERKKIEESVIEWARFLDIEDLLNRKAGTLSLGEKQRVCIARALVKKPRVVIADEPTSSLDCENKKRFAELITQIKKKNMCMVVVTHDISMVEDFDKHYQLIDGKLYKNEVHLW